MRPAFRIPTVTLIVASALAAASCGGSDSDGAQATIAVDETVATEAADTVEEPPMTDPSTAPPATTAPPVVSDPPDETAPEDRATNDEDVVELPTIVPLDIDGAQQIPEFPVDLATPAVPMEPGTTYVTRRLGTEIGFQVQAPLTAAMHEAGILGMDRDGGIVFITQPAEVIGAPETAVPQQSDVNALFDERIADGSITVTDDTSFEVDGRAGRRLRIESGNVQVDPIQVGPGYSVWVIDLDDWTPILVVTESDDDEWLAEIDALAQSLRIGTPTTNPMVYTDEPWLFGYTGEAPAGMLRANVLDGIELNIPENMFISTGSEELSVFLDGSGVEKPTVGIEVPGDLLQPDALWPGFVRLGAVDSVQQIIDSLAPFVSLTPVDSDVELLGSSAAVYDYRREVDDPELEMYTVRPTEWRMESSREMNPASEGRIWLADTDNGPLVVITSAEIDAGTDLADSIAAAEAMISTMAPVSLD